MEHWSIPAGLKHQAACVAALLGMALPLTVSAAQTVTLYNGALGTDPVAQGNLAYGSLPSGTYYTVGSTSMTLDSTSSAAIHSGFSNFGSTNFASFPNLGESPGYTVTLDMQTLTETHNAGSSRAGFSLIALSSDLQGIEIGFWDDEVFSQNSNFTQGETDTFDTTAALTQYNLTIQGTSYTLSAGGTTLLTGALRNYSGAGVIPNVYAIPNFIFIGDDTTEAAGSTVVSSLSVAVPEPMSLGLFSLYAAGLLRRRGRIRK